MGASEYVKNLYSQFGEDGLLEEIFKRIGTKNKFCFEVGASDGRFMSNSRKLIEEGWQALLIEANPAKVAELRKTAWPFDDKVKIFGTTIGDEHTLDRCLDDCHAPLDLDLGVVDIDGQDYYAWLAMVKYRPRVMMVEYDPFVEGEFIPERGSTSGKGSSWKAMLVLGATKGYECIAQTQTNLIFVDPSETPKFKDWGRRSNEKPDDGKIRLNLGAGKTPLEGYENLDRDTGQEVFPLAREDSSVDEVRASHILEHFSHRQTVDVVKEWARVLKPGGILKIAVPDFDYCHAAYANGSDPMIEAYLFGGHTDENDHHGALFNGDKLRTIMRMAGLGRIRKWKSEQIDCASLPVSLNLMGVKPAEAGVKGVSAVLSMPRLCFTEQAACLMQAISKLSLPTRIRQGVFWGQTLTSAFETSIEEDAPKYLLSMDYDTLFSKLDIEDLYQIMEASPEIDALCPMQMGRDRDSVLLTIRKSATENKAEVLREDMETETIPLTTGHFGLTMIRVESLKKLPKPWFIHRPDKDGGWGEGRVDEDISFWRGWEKAGLTLHQANHVVVGHAQLVCTWPDRNLGPLHQYVGDYRQNGKPIGTFA